MILLDVIGIASKYIDSKNIIGIYLTGSYARQEENLESDIDVLIITNDIDKKIIKEGQYSILIISTQLLTQKLNQDLLPIGQMIKEAKPLLNSEYLNLINVKVTKNNIKGYINSTKEKLIIIRKVLNKIKKANKNNLSDAIAYTLILRIRTLHIIEKLIKNENYSKEEFTKIIKKISGGTNAYERYLAMKNDLSDKKTLTIDEGETLYYYLENQLIKVKKLIDK